MIKRSTSQRLYLALLNAAHCQVADGAARIARSMMADNIDLWPDAAHAGGAC